MRATGWGGGRAGRDRVFGLAGLTLEQVRGPWILEKLAEWVMRRRMTTVPWRLTQAMSAGRSLS